MDNKELKVVAIALKITPIGVMGAQMSSDAIKIMMMMIAPLKVLKRGDLYFLPTNSAEAVAFRMDDNFDALRADVRTMLEFVMEQPRIGEDERSVDVDSYFHEQVQVSHLLSGEVQRSDFDHRLISPMPKQVQ